MQHRVAHTSEKPGVILEGYPRLEDPSDSAHGSFYRLPGSMGSRIGGLPKLAGGMDQGLGV
ncbi:MAG TPA: hypothetical protein VMN36_16400 [Verrucomicrobiales bacterium]|nr:hypothetical protein [Verrucomicrobiales bacterium]